MENPILNPQEMQKNLLCKCWSCKACSLYKERKQPVISRGNPLSKILLLGEGPGLTEDENGIPFTGKAGQLMDDLFQQVGINTNDLYVCNCIKCHPPGNRTPTQQEVSACRQYLEVQIETIDPQLFIAVGKPATQVLLGTPIQAMKDWAGKLTYTNNLFGAKPLLIFYHPAAALHEQKFGKTFYRDSIIAHLKQHASLIIKTLSS